MDYETTTFERSILVRADITITITQGSLQPIILTLRIQQILCPLFNFFAALQQRHDLDSKLFIQHHGTDLTLEAEGPSVQPTADDIPSCTLEFAGTAPINRSLIEPIHIHNFPVEISSLIASAIAGLELHQPELCEEGVNGTYFLKNKEGAKIAVFKPDDEEGDSKHNPKRTSDDEAPLRKGILPGEASQREVAAYLLDKDNFSGVPPTALVKMPSSLFGDTSVGTVKQGSFQLFVDNDGAAGDIGTQSFPAKEVHKIGILDIRIMNNDRHEGNVLFQETESGDRKLIPIDHGYSLPHALDGAWFDWMYWPQAKQPFNEEALSYIAAVDVSHDADILHGLGIRNECIRTMKITTTLLKKAAAQGFSLFEIASLICRPTVDEPSMLETMCKQALESIKLCSLDDLSEKNEQLFLEALFVVMDKELKKGSCDASQ